MANLTASHIRDVLLQIYDKALSFRDPDRVGNPDNAKETMMSHTFHFGIVETIFFKQWAVQSWIGMLICCLGFACLAILYEGCKTIRRVLFKRKQVRRTTSPSSLLSETFELDRKSYGSVDHSESESGASAEDALLSTGSSREDDRIRSVGCSGWHWLQALMHVVQVFVGYCLMLAFMTFNGYICAAVLVGAGLGHLIFGWFLHRGKDNPPEEICGD